MSTGKHSVLLDSESNEETELKEPPCRRNSFLCQARKLLARVHHSHLRVSTVGAEEPRRCAQSTSGRSSSQATLPPDSRSISIANDSPQGRQLSATLRRCPALVPHRAAKASRSEGDIVFRKDWRSMPDYHQTVIVNATPFVEFTKWCSLNQDIHMENEAAETRRENLRRLIERDFRDNQSLFARAYAPGNEKPSFINDLVRKGSKKSFGEKTARKIEMAAGLLPGQLSLPNSPLLRDSSRQNQTSEELHNAIENLTEVERRELLAAVLKITSRRQSAPPRARISTTPSKSPPAFKRT